MIETFVLAKNLPKFRITQFNQAYYRDLISSFDEFFTWSKSLREELKQALPFSVITPLKELTSADKGTVKVLFGRQNDNKRFESVLMKHKDGRNTICVSCMVGCPVKCFFCATGRMPEFVNLTDREIVDQVLYFARKLKLEGEKVTNIVFMGMGEPLLNTENVSNAIKVLTDPEKLAFSIRRITVSTSGITPKLQELIASGYRGRIALSLHAPNQELREKLMPIAKAYPLRPLVSELIKYADMTNKRVSYEYILIDGVNDSPQEAAQLGKLLGTKLTHVNLIPYNPIVGIDYKRSRPANIKKFCEVLTTIGIHHTLRVTMGDDIKAACGQLAGDYVATPTRISTHQ